MERVYYKSKCGNEYISEHFQYKEFACHDGTDRFLLDTDMIPLIEKYRQYEERSQRINSAYRTESYNARPDVRWKKIKFTFKRTSFRLTIL